MGNVHRVVVNNYGKVVGWHPITLFNYEVPTKVVRVEGNVTPGDVVPLVFVVLWEVEADRRLQSLRFGGLLFLFTPTIPTAIVVRRFLVSPLPFTHFLKFFFSRVILVGNPLVQQFLDVLVVNSLGIPFTLPVWSILWIRLIWTLIPVDT